VALRCQGERIEGIGGSRSLEPLLAGDRQMRERVAKATNPLQTGRLETGGLKRMDWKSVSRELPDVALVASRGRV
jgi:hypothetical protein